MIYLIFSIKVKLWILTSSKFRINCEGELSKGYDWGGVGDESDVSSSILIKLKISA